MIKIKNTNKTPTPVQIGTGVITLAPFQILEVEEAGLATLPEGIIKWNDQVNLTEIDPYSDKKLTENPQDNINLLLG